MAFKKIIKSIDINAPAEKVWEVLTTDATYRVWAAEFMAGSYFETDWKEGSRVRFLGTGGDGLAGDITVSIPNEKVVMVYDAWVKNNQEDKEGEEAKAIAGSSESYALTENEDKTIHLHVEVDMDEKWFDDMAASWDRALERIKELAEKAE